MDDHLCSSASLIEGPELGSPRELALNYHDMGILLRENGNAVEALAACQQALTIYERLAQENPNISEFRAQVANCQCGIGLLFYSSGKPGEAQLRFEQAISVQEQLVRENPSIIVFQSDLGRTLTNLAALDLDAQRFAEARDRLLQAIEYQKRVLTANGRHLTHQQLLKNQYSNLLQAATGLKDASLAADARRGLAELAASDPQFAALDERMTAVLGGEAAKDAAELLTLAQRAYDTQRFALAARFYDEAMKHDTTLADNRETQHAYNAACCAALASSGETLDNPPPDEAARLKLRGQALVWLKAELDRWTKYLETATPEQLEVVRRTQEHWQTDVDLAGVRDEGELAKVPDAERADWQTLWRRVDELIAQTAVVSTELSPR